MTRRPKFRVGQVVKHVDDRGNLLRYLAVYRRVKNTDIYELIENGNTPLHRVLEIGLRHLTKRERGKP